MFIDRSHHEKIVVVDHQVCFIGGLDLCFGRYDSSEHKVGDCPPRIWPGKDYYNPRYSFFTFMSLLCVYDFINFKYGEYLRCRSLEDAFYNLAVHWICFVFLQHICRWVLHFAWSFNRLS